jgi:hypothetical protein
MNFDIFFVSFNEAPQEKNWRRVQKLHPNAMRIHGVEGIDRAHNICNRLSKTEWFWTIDGDNWLIRQLQWTKNFINGVDLVMFKSLDPIVKNYTYLGGVKLWHKDKMINTDMS